MDPGLGLLWDLQQLLELQDPSENTGRTSCPAESGGNQDLGVFANLGRCESVALAGKAGRSGFETGDTAVNGNRAGFGHKAETEAAADADAGQADYVPKVWPVLPLPAVLAEVGAAEAGQWVWLGGTENESAVGS